jgi:hypothetical protein
MSDLTPRWLPAREAADYVGYDTNLAEAGCSAHEIAAITGHRSLALVSLYTASADQERMATAAIVRLQTREA